MTANRVTYSNLFSESWNNIYSLVNNKSNVVDPSSSLGEYRKWIYSRDPDVKNISFSDFPYIIVMPLSVDTDKKQSLNSKSGMVNFVCDVEVICCDREFGERDGKGAIDNDSISNDVVETFNNATNKTILRSNGMAFSRINSSDIAIEEFNNTLIYRRTITLGFSSRKRISS
jgi:hypothetical protein